MSEFLSSQSDNVERGDFDSTRSLDLTADSKYPSDSRSAPKFPRKKSGYYRFTPGVGRVFVLYDYHYRKH
jgi:hypothetical protein